MKKTVLFALWMMFAISCKKETVGIHQELREGAWLFLKAEDTDGSVILNGEGEPKLLFFFTDNNVLKGRMKGEYAFLENDNLYFQATIDTLVRRTIVNSAYSPPYDTFDILGNFPSRYYEFENIVRNGIQGKVGFIRNGWDSRFSISYADGKKMWFERY